MSDSSGLLSDLADRLYRWRWWVSSVLVGLSFVLGTPDASTPAFAWVPFALLLLLVWLPVLVRWGQATRAARTAFREGFFRG